MHKSEMIVVAAGPGPSHVDTLPGGALVIAADGGLDRCVELGLRADVVVGDLDSAPADLVAAAERDGATVIRHPVRKDATDLELALDEAINRGAERVVVVASAAGRLDHLLSSLLLLGSERYAGIEVDAAIGDAVVHVVRGGRERELVLEAGETVTLLALHGRADGVRTTGLEYPLAGETLEAGSSRGVSNVAVESRVSVAVEHGVLLAVRPGAHA